MLHTNGSSASPGDADLREDIARCVHCGFCLQACPTYVILGKETDSPRGRIALIDAVTSGRAAPTPALLGHLDLCLQCRACETACPSGVPFGRIMETARASLQEDGRAPHSWRMRAAALRLLLPHTRRLGLVMGMLRSYDRSPLRRWAQRSQLLTRLSPQLATRERQLPRMPGAPFRPPPQRAGLTRSIGMLVGCVAPHLYPRTHYATIRVLNRLGYRVILGDDQTCCGALSVHAGDRETARALARRTIDSFLTSGVEAIVVNSAGCGSTMKEYAELLQHDPHYATLAQRFSAITQDILEFVAKQDLPRLGAVRRKVTYQDSCHLVHAQKVRAAPRALLHAIPELELVELSAPDRCCGSAGIFSMVQPAMSQQLLTLKMDDVQATGATIVATANPGCMMQLEAGLLERGISGRVVHVIELLDAAMLAAGGPPA